MHHLLDNSLLQKKWWNAWLKIDSRFTLNTVKDNKLQVLLLVLTMFHISDKQREIFGKENGEMLKTKFHSLHWIFAIRMQSAEEDVSFTPIKLLFSSETASKMQTTHSSNQYHMSELDSIKLVINWLFFHKIKSKLGLWAAILIKRHSDFNLWFIVTKCLNHLSEDIKFHILMEHLDSTLEFLAMIWRLQIQFIVKI